MTVNVNIVTQTAAKIPMFSPEESRLWFSNLSIHVKLDIRNTTIKLLNWI